MIRGWFLAVGIRRATVEAAVLLFALVLPFATVFAGAAENTRWAVLTQAGVQAGLLVGVLAALRLRPAAATQRRQLGRALQAGGLLGSGIWLAGILSVFLAFGLAFTAAFVRGEPLAIAAPSDGPVLSDPWVIVVTAVVVGAAGAATALIFFGIGRVLVAVWKRWDRMRRAKLRWALTHSLLIASLILAALIGAFLSGAAFRSSRFPDDGLGLISPQAPWIEQTLATIVFLHVPSWIALFAAPLLLSLLIVPPVALIAFPVLARATRRIEELAVATTAVRAGDLSARATVTGEDEIARLQADFNAMAADLERSLGALRAERDAVKRLLDDRRELVASVSHELRTPLATLRGYLDSALDHGNQQISPAMRQDLDIMASEADRLHRLIDDLFTLSRAEVDQLPLTIEPTAIAPLLERIVTTMAPLAWSRGRVELTAQAPGDLPAAAVDPERLEQIVRNLVANAVRHTPPGGLVLVSAEATGDGIAIQVRDTGEGIAATDLPQVWNRFYRAGNAGDRAGAGLGLALVKELTEAMGGAVTVESMPGEGSCFTVRLPIAPVADRQPAPPATVP